MGPELGSDCRDLVLPFVVTQGIYFDSFGCLVLFLNPSSWLIRRRCVSHVPDLSLSQRPLVSLKCLHLPTCLSLGKRDPGFLPHILFSSSCLHSQQLALSSPALGMARVTWTSPPSHWPLHPGQRGTAHLTWSGGPGVWELRVCFTLPLEQVLSADLKGILFLYLY